MDSLQYVLTLLADLTDDEKLTAALVEAADGLVTLTESVVWLFLLSFLYVCCYILWCEAILHLPMSLLQCTCCMHVLVACSLDGVFIEQCFLLSTCNFLLLVKYA